MATARHWALGTGHWHRHSHTHTHTVPPPHPPIPQGAKFLYDHVLKQALLRGEKHIDKALAHAGKVTSAVQDAARTTVGGAAGGGGGDGDEEDSDFDDEAAAAVEGKKGQ